MPTPTYTPLATVTLASNTSAVTFSNIPATYRDLILVSNGAGSTTISFCLRLNSDTGANYSRVVMAGNSGGAFSFSESGQTRLAVGYWETGRSVLTATIMDYSATDKHKTTLSRSGVEGTNVHAMAGRWANTAAVNTVQALPDSGNFVSGSTFSLYGVIA